MENKNVIQTYLENNVQVKEIEVHDMVHRVLITPENKQIIDLEKYQVQPNRVRETVSFNDLRGFIDYVNEFKTPNTICFAGSSEIRVVFDYHENKDNVTTPHWGSHSAVFKMRTSNRWDLWTAIHNQWMLQKKFTDFLDSGLNEIIAPTQAEILQLVSSFRATTTYELDTLATPGGGQNIGFRKITKGSDTLKSEIQLPEYITLALQPYENLSVINDRLKDTDLEIPAYELKAKISWQADFADEEKPKLAFKIQILNVENVVNKTLEAVKQAVVHLTEVKTFIA